MYPAGKDLLLGQGPYPYSGGSVYVILSIMILTFAAVCSIVFIVRRLSPQTPMQKTPGHLSSRFAGFIVGFLIVAITAILVAFLTYANLESIVLALDKLAQAANSTLVVSIHSPISGR